MPDVREHAQFVRVPEVAPTHRRTPVARTTEKKDGEVVTVSSTEAQNALGHLLNRVAKGARVVLTRYNRREAVILSATDYDALLADEEVDLGTLEREFDQLVDRMQTPGHRGAVESLFRLSGEELGETAGTGGDIDHDDP